MVCGFVFSGGACTVAVIGTPGSVKCSNLRDQVSWHVQRGVPGEGGPVSWCLLRLSAHTISTSKHSVLVT